MVAFPQALRPNVCMSLSSLPGLLRVSILTFLFFCNNNNNNNNNSKVIPVIIVATGPISKSFRKYLRNGTGKHDNKTTETKPILGAADILRKILM